MSMHYVMLHIGLLECGNDKNYLSFPILQSNKYDFLPLFVGFCFVNWPGNYIGKTP